MTSAETEASTPHAWLGLGLELGLGLGLGFGFGLGLGLASPSPNPSPNANHACNFSTVSKFVSASSLTSSALIWLVNCLGLGFGLTEDQG